MSAEDPKPQAQAEAWFHSLLDTAVDGIIVTDADGGILAFNKACENLFGYSAGEIMGHGINRIMPRGEAAHHNKHIARYMKTGKKRIIGVGREVSARHRDGTEFPIELSIGEADTKSGRQFIGIIRDLRSRKKTETRLRQLQVQLEHLSRVSAMNELGSAIAHELNQPLTAIMLYLQAAVQDEGNDGKIDRDVLAKASREAERAGQILQGMRRFAEKGEVERHPVEIHGVIDEAVELLGPSLHERHIRLHRAYARDAAYVNADPVQIQQIIVNLVRNAMEAVLDAEKKTILIETDINNGVLEVAVEDNGTGLEDDLLPDLFRAFSPSRSGGMGLGLAIARSIARRHDGDLGAEPEDEGRGARFVLTLPLITEHENG